MAISTALVATLHRAVELRPILSNSRYPKGHISGSRDPEAQIGSAFGFQSAASDSLAAY